MNTDLTHRIAEIRSRHASMLSTSEVLQIAILERLEAMVPSTTAERVEAPKRRGRPPKHPVYVPVEE